MFVFLDTNVLVSDPWLRGQKYRLLTDYVSKTQGRILILEAVQLELRSVMRRRFRSAVAALEKAQQDARVLGVDLPARDGAETLAEETFDKWDDEVTKQFKRLGVRIVPLDPSILRDAFVRTADRIPPATEDGKESRDVIIWLSFLRALAMPNGQEVAFISQNAKHFGDAERSEFRAELKSDLAGYSGSIRFYKSLEEFNREHAQPLAHITNEWIMERIPPFNVPDLVEDYLAGHTEPRHYRIVSSDYRDEYQAFNVELRYAPDVELQDIYVWRIAPDRLELSLDFEVRQSAELECELVRAPFSASTDEEREQLRREWPSYRGLTGELDGTVSVSASVVGGELAIGRVENLYL